MRVSVNISENSEQLGRQAQPRIEPGNFRQPVFRAEPRSLWAEKNHLAFHGGKLPVIGISFVVEKGIGI